MKKRNAFFAVIMSAAILTWGCSSMNNAAKGTAIGAGSGAAVGAGLGAIIGKDGKSTAIGAAIGTAVGATAGVLIGKKMDKAAEQAAVIEGAQVETITDSNDLQAVKVTFDSGILFETNKSDLNAASRKSLQELSTILLENPTMDVSIMGHTDNTGTLAVNQRLSLERAQSVASYLRSNAVPAAQITDIEGKDYSEPVADNSTVAGRAANRRVEIYLYASQQMINEAKQEAGE